MNQKLETKNVTNANNNLIERKQYNLFRSIGWFLKEKQANKKSKINRNQFYLFSHKFFHFSETLNIFFFYCFSFAWNFYSDVYFYFTVQALTFVLCLLLFHFCLPANRKTNERKRKTRVNVIHCFYVRCPTFSYVFRSVGFFVSMKQFSHFFLFFVRRYYFQTFLRYFYCFSLYNNFFSFYFSIWLLFHHAWT